MFFLEFWRTHHRKYILLAGAEHFSPMFLRLFGEMTHFSEALTTLFWSDVDDGRQIELK